MGNKFFDSFVEVSGNWIGKEEKKTMVTDETPFPVLAVAKANTGKYGPRYVVKTELDGEERLLSFAASGVESRDRLFDALIEYQERDDAEPVVVKMKQSGQSILVVNAEE